MPYQEVCAECGLMHPPVARGECTVAKGRQLDESAGDLCVTCHPGEVDNFGEILARHTGGCAQCHDETRSTVVGSQFADIPQVILQGGILEPITCLDCHYDKRLTHETDHDVTGFVRSEPLCVTASCHVESVLTGIHNKPSLEYSNVKKS